MLGANIQVRLFLTNDRVNTVCRVGVAHRRFHTSYSLSLHSSVRIKESWRPINTRVKASASLISTGLLFIHNQANHLSWFIQPAQSTLLIQKGFRFMATAGTEALHQPNEAWSCYKALHLNWFFIKQSHFSRHFSCKCNMFAEHRAPPLSFCLWGMDRKHQQVDLSRCKTAFDPRGVHFTQVSRASEELVIFTSWFIQTLTAIVMQCVVKGSARSQKVKLSQLAS